MGDQIECPKHNGRFDIRTGAPLRAPVCVALATWPARVVDGHIEIEV
jgi:3-phenylpropionate/trans-cinnamate dioxygenase ferredoxin subunit